jgi:hypothetical protein
MTGGLAKVVESLRARHSNLASDLNVAAFDVDELFDVTACRLLARVLISGVDLASPTIVPQKGQVPVLGITAAQWEAFGRGGDLPDRIHDKVLDRLCKLASDLKVDLHVSDLFSTTAQCLLERVLLSVDPMPLLADRGECGPFAVWHKSGPKSAFSAAELADARRLIDEQPARQSIAEALKPIVRARARGTFAEERVLKALLNALKWDRYPRRRNPAL